MLQLLENHVKAQRFFFFFFQIFQLGNIFWIFLEKNHQKISINHFFGTFWSKVSKILHKLKIWKKKKKKKKKERSYKRSVLTWFSSNFSISNSKLFFFSLSHFFTNKVICYHFLKKSAFFGKIWYQKRILGLISIIYLFIMQAI